MTGRFSLLQIQVLPLGPIRPKEVLDIFSTRFREWPERSGNWLLSLSSEI